MTVAAATIVPEAGGGGGAPGPASPDTAGCVGVATGVLVSAGAGGGVVATGVASACDSLGPVECLSSAWMAGPGMPRSVR